MKIPNDLNRIICDYLMEMLIEYSRDCQFAVDDTETNGILAYLIEGDNYRMENDKIYISLYSVLKYWRDNE